MYIKHKQCGFFIYLVDKNKICSLAFCPQKNKAAENLIRHCSAVFIMRFIDRSNHFFLAAGLRLFRFVKTELSAVIRLKICHNPKNISNCVNFSVNNAQQILKFTLGCCWQSRAIPPTRILAVRLMMFV